MPMIGAPDARQASPRAPPWVTATMRPPALAAVLTASRVSSVLPENDMANTSVRSLTYDGGS